jgi:hypothetical protein
LIRPPDADADHDLSWIGGGLVLLGLLGLVGMFLYLFNDQSKDVERWRIEWILPVGVILIVLPAVGIGIAARSKSPGSILIGVGGTLVIVLTSLGLAFVLVIAFIISIFSACTGGCKPSPVPPSRTAPPPPGPVVPKGS